MKQPEQSDAIVRDLAHALASQHFHKVLALLVELEPFVETADEKKVLRNARWMAISGMTKPGRADDADKADKADRAG
ncbi:MAG TPA: hypothetical protein VEL07_07835 [Planctomycetota bacterium]|nr:hypothetical protein [Planctomycetota bacterium]